MAELDQTAVVYEGLYNAMIERFKARDYKAADNMASRMLEKADLPLLYRAWCHMILGSAGAGAVEAGTQHSNFLGHAQAAVDLIEDAKNAGTPFPEDIVKRAQKILDHAKEAMAELEEAGVFADKESKETTEAQKNGK